MTSLWGRINPFGRYSAAARHAQTHQRLGPQAARPTAWLAGCPPPGDTFLEAHKGRPPGGSLAQR
jgi:hypothetical protein